MRMVVLFTFLSYNEYFKSQIGYLENFIIIKSYINKYNVTSNIIKIKTIKNAFFMLNIVINLIFALKYTC